MGAVLYWILFFMFIGLDVFGFYNIIIANRIGKLKTKSILIFYVSSIIVLTIRIVLFSDVFIGWGDNLYQIGLLTLPTFMYLLTGLSLVMCNFELVVKFRMLDIDQNLSITALEK